VLQKAEVLMAALDGAGLAGQDISLVAEALQNYITGAQQSARDARDAETRSGITDEQWIELLRPVLEEHFDAATYPALARLGEARRERRRCRAANAPPASSSAWSGCWTAWRPISESATRDLAVLPASL